LLDENKDIKIIGKYRRAKSNEPLYINTVIGTLAVDMWNVTFFYSKEGPRWAAAPPSFLLVVPNVTAHPSTASVPTSCYSMWIMTFAL